MSLVKCPECGKEISNTAESCPSCGYAIKALAVKRNLEELRILKLVGIFFVFIGMLALFKEPVLGIFMIFVAFLYVIVLKISVQW